MMKMFWNFIEVPVAQHCECTRCYQIVHIEMFNVTLYDSHVIKKELFSGHNYFNLHFKDKETKHREVE